MKFPSKKKLEESRQNFPLLSEDDYCLKIKEIKEERQKKYQSEEMEDVLNIVFEIISYMDGSEMKDEEDNVVKDRLMFFTARPNSIGFKKDGTPAITRAFIAYSTDQDIFEELEIDKWEDLLGKEINAEIIHYVNQKNEKKNKIGRFISPRKRNKAKKEYDDIPIINEGEEEIDVKDIPL